MTTIEIQQFNMLQDVITEFSSNPNKKRSTSIVGTCTYNPPFNKPLSRGCAIGMFLSTSVASKLDKKKNTSIKQVINSLSKHLLPKWMQKMNINFLDDVQKLHDGDYNWDENSMSNIGKTTVSHICRRYELPFSDIKFSN